MRGRSRAPTSKKGQIWAKRNVNIMADNESVPAETAQGLKRVFEEEQLENGRSSQPILPVDSAVTKAEKQERNGSAQEEFEEPSAKRLKIEGSEAEAPKVDARTKIKGIAMVKAEFVNQSSSNFIANNYNQIPC